MINVFFLITLTPLDNMARFVIVIEPALIASEIPGTLRSATAKVASGVRSLGESPVPPVVLIKSTCRLSLNRIRCVLI